MNPSIRSKYAEIILDRLGATLLRKSGTGWVTVWRAPGGQRFTLTATGVNGGLPNVYQELLAQIIRENFSTALAARIQVLLLRPDPLTEEQINRALGIHNVYGL